MSRLLAPTLALFLAVGQAAAVGPNEVDDALTKMFSAAKAGDDQAAVDAATTVVAFGESAAPRLVSSLTTPNRTASEIAWALRCLKVLRSPLAKDPAFALCGHASAEVRGEAILTAAAVGGDAAVTLMLKLAGDPDAMVRRRAFDGLLQSDSTASEIIPVAARGILDPDTWVVIDAVQILDRFPVPADFSKDKVVEAVGAGVGRLEDHNAAAVFDFLVRRAGIQCGPILHRALDLKNTEVVVQALDAAGRVRLVSAITKISRLAKGSDRRVAKAAIECLSKINEAPSVPFLIDMLDGARDAEMIDAIAVALRGMTGMLHGTDVIAWRKWLAAQR
jgi:HEAT repeat protein